MNRWNVQWIKVSGCVLLFVAFATAQQTAPSGVQIVPQEVSSFYLKGRSLTADEAKRLEEALVGNPSDIASRFTLISYYFGKFSEKEAKERRCTHVLWTIENLSSSDLLHHFPVARLNPYEKCYETGKQLWLRSLDSSKGNLVVLRNAVDYFMIPDKLLAEKLLRQGVAAEPQNFKWHADLGQLFKLQVSVERDSVRRREVATKAVEEFELALKLAVDPIQQRNLKMDLGRMAFEAGDVVKAQAIAAKALDEDAGAWLRSDEVHSANTTLGLIALQNGDVQEAKRRLMLSADVEGSPVLNSFGPSMILAKGLLERGETQAVVEYLAQVGSFWKDRRITEWVAELRQGRTPNFGGNGTR